MPSLRVLLGPKQLLLLQAPYHSRKHNQPDHDEGDSHDTTKNLQAATVKDAAYDRSSRGLER